MAGLVHSEAFFHEARYALLVDVEGCSRWADALSVDVSHESTFDLAELCLVALHGCVALVSGQAYANHGAQGHGIDHLALGIDSTWFGCVARVYALAADASGLRWTVSIVLAQRLQSTASLNHVADVTWGAGAFWAMVVHLAELVTGTGSTTLARVLAARVDAGLVQRTLRIASASHNDARGLRVARVSGFAFANRAVVDSIAVRVSCARVLLAHWNTLTVDAGVLTRTFIIRSTSHLSAFNLRISVVSLEA